MDSADYSQAAVPSSGYLPSNNLKLFDSTYDNGLGVTEELGERSLLIQDFDSYMFEHALNDSQSSLLTSLYSNQLVLPSDQYPVVFV